MQKSEAKPPGDISGKVLEFTNANEIARAAKYATAEIQTNLELGMANSESKTLILEAIFEVVKNIGLGQTSTELSKSIDELLDTIGKLDDATLDLIAGAKEQIKELAEELEQIEKRESPQRVSISDIDEELDRRQTWMETEGDKQERLEDEREAIRERVKDINQRLDNKTSKDALADKSESLRLKKQEAILTQTIDKIVGSLLEINREVEQLQAYKNAIKLVSDGLPTMIVGKK